MTMCAFGSVVEFGRCCLVAPKYEAMYLAPLLLGTRPRASTADPSRQVGQRISPTRNRTSVCPLHCRSCDFLMASEAQSGRFCG